jgi:hypothetical protein
MPFISTYAINQRGKSAVLGFKRPMGLMINPTISTLNKADLLSRSP